MPSHLIELADKRNIAPVRRMVASDRDLQVGRIATVHRRKAVIEEVS
jgi:hypothetical protein